MRLRLICDKTIVVVENWDKTKLLVHLYEQEHIPNKLDLVYANQIIKRTDQLTVLNSTDQKQAEVDIRVVRQRPLFNTALLGVLFSKVKNAV